MEPTINGGCACGAIRYAVSRAPAFSLICQCRQCQRISGAGHSAQFAVPVESVTVQGEIKFFGLTADDGNSVASGFCANCGSPILKKTSGSPQYLFIHAATMDDPGLFQPQMVVWSGSRQPWDYVDPKLALRY